MHIAQSRPQPEENAKGGEKFLGKIGLKEPHSLCSRCLHFHYAFFYQF